MLKDNTAKQFEEKNIHVNFFNYDDLLRHNSHLYLKKNSSYVYKLYSHMLKDNTAIYFKTTQPDISKMFEPNIFLKTTQPYILGITG